MSTDRERFVAATSQLEYERQKAAEFTEAANAAALRGRAVTAALLAEWQSTTAHTDTTTEKENSE